MSLTTWDPDAFLHITTNLLRKYSGIRFFFVIKVTVININTQIIS